MAPGMDHRDRARRRQRGQVLVLVALAMVALLASAAVAFDLGRFYSERRHLQNAVDAAALAGVGALIRGADTTLAEAEARTVLARNLAGGPNGILAPMPPAVPEYEPGHAGNPSRLSNGILVTSSEVRVAVRTAIPYTFGRAVGLDASAIGARARARLEGRLLPIAARRFVNAPGPNSGATYPCTDNQTKFMDFFSTANTACLGTDSDGSLRTEPSAGAPFDPANPDNDRDNHGPIFTILGQGAQPSNGADFRGFIVLDIRNFAHPTSQLYYNGVTPAMNQQTLKGLEAAWITSDGYPGPGFPAATVPPDPNDQVAIFNGNSTGAAIDAMITRYVAGDEILVGVYSGVVMAIPDFSLSTPTQISLPNTGTVTNAGTMRVSRNQAFSGTVELSTEPDLVDPANPMVTGTLLGGSTPITYDPNPVTPSIGSGTIVNLRNVSTNAAPSGIYALWIKGFAGSPYLSTKLEPLALKIGSVTRDFSLSVDSQSKQATNAGDTVTFTLTLQNAPNTNTAFGGPVSLSVDPPLPSGVGAITFSPSSVTPTKAGASSTLSINTGSLAPGTHKFTIRATGMNGDSTPVPVTHLLTVAVDVASSGSGQQTYIDLIGFAVLRIASIPAVGQTGSPSNFIDAYAITPVVPDLNDPRLRRAQTARLVPWS